MSLLGIVTGIVVLCGLGLLVMLAFRPKAKPTRLAPPTPPADAVPKHYVDLTAEFPAIPRQGRHRTDA